MTQAIQNKLAALLGLCLRSGQLETGQEACVQLIRSGKAGVVFIDASSSENTCKRLTNACRSHQVPLLCLDEGILGHSIGRESCLVAALGPGGFCEKILSLGSPQANDTDYDKSNSGVQMLP